ncbi:hypothetical protein D3C71_1830150 [compost metagenome]
MSVHRYETVDVETDAEPLFKAFLGVPGVNVTYVDSDMLGPLYRHVSPGSPVYPVIAEIYAIEKDEPIQVEPEEPRQLPWYRRLIKYLKGMFIND